MTTAPIRTRPARIGACGCARPASAASIGAAARASINRAWCWKQLWPAAASPCQGDAWPQRILPPARIVKLAEIDQPVEFAYYLVYPAERRQSAKCTAFREWVIAEAEELARRRRR